MSLQGVDKNEIDVIWAPEIAKNKLVISKGNQIDKIGYEYGRNSFELQIAPNLKFSVGHFKTNNWHSHRYYIDVEKDKSGFEIKFTAKGPNQFTSRNKYDLEGNSIEMNVLNQK